MKKFLIGLTVLSLVVLLGGGLVLAKDKYTIASDTTWPPFEWVDTAGNFYGFDLDAMRLIAVLEGYEIEIITAEWDPIFDNVGIGRFDIGASGATMYPWRMELCDFSDPYWTSDQAILVRAVEIEVDGEMELVPEYNIVTALSGGHTVGAQINTTGAGWIQENLIAEGVDVKLAEYPLYPLAVLDLLNGNIDAVIQDEPASRATVAAEEGLLINGVIETGEQFGFFVTKGDPHGLLEKINRGMKKLQASGAWNNLIRTYMGGAELADIEAAWQSCKHLLDAGDADGFAKCLADTVVGE